jgi:hypothetical protein
MAITDQQYFNSYSKCDLAFGDIPCLGRGTGKVALQSRPFFLAISELQVSSCFSASMAYRYTEAISLHPNCRLSSFHCFGDF